VAEQVAQMFGKLASTPSRVPTRLTQANRSAGRDNLRRRPKRQEAPQLRTLPKACRMCGEILPSPGHLYCDDCRPIVKAENLTRFQASGPATLARLVAEGRDPSHGGNAARKRGAIIARRNREAAEWERTHHGAPDRIEFKRDVLPRIRGVPLNELAKTTGLSLQYCSLIRGGLYVPHPRHWDVFRRLGEKSP